MHNPLEIPSDRVVRVRQDGMSAVRPIVGVIGATSGSVPLTTGISGEADGSVRVALIEFNASTIGKILGTSSPNAGTNTLLYTSAAGTITKVTALSVCNRGSTKVTVRLGIDVGGNGSITPNDGEWIYYDLDVEGNSTVLLDAAQGLLLGALDDIVVHASASTVSFIASGSTHT